MSRDQWLTREEVARRIERGELLVIYHNRVLKLNGWLAMHPGGPQVIYHMVGRDASDEMDMYHSEDARRLMCKYQVAQCKLPWENIDPPIQRGDLDPSVLGDLKSSSREDHVRDRVIQKDSFDLGNQVRQCESLMPSCVVADQEAWLQRDLQKFPSLDQDTQESIRKEFRKLHSQLEGAGLFVGGYSKYLSDFVRLSILVSLGVLFYSWRYQSAFSSLWIALSGLCLGLFWHQVVFIVHDAGHTAISHNYYFDNLFAIFLADLCGGLSAGWWKKNHNVHHIVTNDPAHDPDIQHLPFFAVSSKFLTSIFSTFYKSSLVYDVFAKFFIPLQHYTYYFVLCFGRFNLYFLSWNHLLFDKGPLKGRVAFFRRVELVGLLLFQYWYWYLLVGKGLHTKTDRWMFVLISHCITMLVHIQITLSHFAMSTADLGVKESFPQRQLRTTMDIDCPAWLDFIHGGLQFQAIHHLFPRMPRHNFRTAQPYVKEFATKVGLEYKIYGFVAGNTRLVNRLSEVAKQARILAECTQFCQKEAAR